MRGGGESWWMLAITARLCPSHPAAIHSPMYSLLTSHHFLSRLPQTRTATKSFDLAKISHVTVHNNNDQSGRQPHITQSSHQENPIGFGWFSSFLSHRPTPCSHLSSGRPALALAGHPTAPASAASKPGSLPARWCEVTWPPRPSPPPAPPYWFTTTPHAPATLVTQYSSLDVLHLGPLHQPSSEPFNWRSYWCIIARLKVSLPPILLFIWYVGRPA